MFVFVVIGYLFALAIPVILLAMLCLVVVTYIEERSYNAANAHLAKQIQGREYVAVSSVDALKNISFEVVEVCVARTYCESNNCNKYPWQLKAGNKSLPISKAIFGNAYEPNELDKAVCFLTRDAVFYTSPEGLKVIKLTPGIKEKL